MKKQALRKFFMACAAALLLTASYGKTTASQMPIRHYYQMLDSLCTGWHTWDTRSMFTQLYLPEAFSVKVSLMDEKGQTAGDLRAGNPRNDAAKVHPREHTSDNSYSEVDAIWHGVSVKLRSTSAGDRLIMMLTPLADNDNPQGRIHVKPEYCWPNVNRITGSDRLQIDGTSHFLFSRRDNHVRMPGGIVGKNIQYSDGAYTCDASASVLIYTGDSLSMEEAE